MWRKRRGDEPQWLVEALLYVPDGLEVHLHLVPRYLPMRAESADDGWYITQALDCGYSTPFSVSIREDWGSSNYRHFLSMALLNCGDVVEVRSSSGDARINLGSTYAWPPCR